MANHHNRFVLLCLVAMGGCSESASRLPGKATQLGQALSVPAEAIKPPPALKEMARPVPVSAIGTSLSLSDGRPNYDALRAAYGEPNSHVVLNPRLTNIAQTKGFQGVEVKPDELVFPIAPSGWLFDKSPGDVLVCGTECGPQGVLRRISYVEARGNEVVVGTTMGKLSDLVQDGWVHIETPLRTPDLSEGSDAERDVHHQPRYAQTEGSTPPNIYKSWPGSGLTGSPFQTSLAVQYSVIVDLTASGNNVEYLAIYVKSTTSLAVATGLVQTKNTYVTQDTVTSGAPQSCPVAGSTCWSGTPAYTNQTITRHTTTTTSDILTPVPFPPLPFPMAPVPPTTVVGPIVTYGPTTVQISNNSYNPAPPIYGAFYSNATVMTLSGPDLTATGSTTVTDFNPQEDVVTAQLPTEYPQVGIPGLVIIPVLTTKVGASLSWTGQVNVLSNINFQENGEAGLSYTPSTGFTVIASLSDTYDWPSASGLPNSSLVATGTPNSTFTGTGLFGVSLAITFNDGVAGPVISRTVKPTISVDYSSGGQCVSMNGVQVCDTGSNTQSCNNSHLFADVQGSTTGLVDIGNLNQNYTATFPSHSINLPIPAQGCPPCTYSVECAQSGEGYACINGSCQPDTADPTCLQGGCGGGENCGPHVPCVYMTLTNGETESCCNGVAQGQTACAYGGCNPGTCGAGYACNSDINCCEPASCPDGMCGSCGSGFECDPTGKSQCCVPASCLEDCTNCTDGLVCDFKDHPQCCVSSTCQYGTCGTSSSDCQILSGVDKTTGAETYSQLPMTCQSGCCVPNVPCATGVLCEQVPKGTIGKNDYTVCPGGGAEFSCSVQASSPWCCTCANSPNNATCLNGNVCPSGTYCDGIGCCYNCNSGTPTDSAGDSCYDNSVSGRQTTCGVTRLTDAGYVCN